ncbi:unannotated protein [freshwater metagenome]|uniref:Unannotated protein n=1 Tax=freshwater metagenome TaxID=449393 RepID=A0A6J6EAA0_9ZZZZ
MSERGYRGSRLVRSAKEFIRDEGGPEKVCAARVIQQSLTLSLDDARALSFQHGGEFAACDVHSRTLAGGFSCCWTTAVKPFAPGLSQSLS